MVLSVVPRYINMCIKGSRCPGRMKLHLIHETHVYGSREGNRLGMRVCLDL